MVSIYLNPQKISGCENAIQKPSWIHDEHDETKVYDPATGKLVRLDVSRRCGFHGDFEDFPEVTPAMGRIHKQTANVF